MLKTTKYKIVIFLILLFATFLIGSLLTNTGSKQNKDVIRNGVVTDKLVILGSGNKSKIDEAISKYQGKITLEIKETETYEVKFPVKSLEELNTIKNSLNEMGIKTVSDYVIE